MSEPGRADALHGNAGHQRDVSSTTRATMTLTAVLGMNQNVSPVRRVTRMPLAVSSDLNCSAKSGGSARQIVPASPTMSLRRRPRSGRGQIQRTLRS